MTAEQSVVYVVEDDQNLRESLESLLRSVGYATMTFGSTQEFLSATQLALPGCLILDVRLPGRSGLEFQRELAAGGSTLPIIFITAHADVPMSVAAMKAGALEFLPKPFREQDLLDAVDRGIALARERRALAITQDDLQQRLFTLTPRERETMQLVVMGQANKEIGRQLGISEVTVKVHRAQVMTKMKADSLPELVRMADRLADITPKA